MMSLCLWSVLAFAAMLSTVSCHPTPPFITGPDLINLHDRFNLICDLRVLSITPDLLKKYPLYDTIMLHSINLPDGTPVDEVLTRSENASSTTYGHGDWRPHIEATANNYVTVMLEASAESCADAGLYKCLGRLKALNGGYHEFRKEKLLQIRNCAQGRRYSTAPNSYFPTCHISRRNSVKDGNPETETVELVIGYMLEAQFLGQKDDFGCLEN